MNATDYVLSLRGIDFILIVTLLVLTSGRLTRDWQLMTPRARVARVHLFLYLLVIGYGTVESMAQDNPPGLRVYMLLIVNVSFLVNLWRSRHGDPVEFNPETTGSSA